MSYKAVNPFNGKTIREFADATDAEVEQALKKANAFYHAAKKQPVSERTAQLERLAHEFTAHNEKYARLLTTNMGKLIGQARSEVKKNVEFAMYYVKNGAQILQPIPYNNIPDKNAHVEFSSIGTIMSVEPWNFPYTQIMRVFAPNFIIGNPVILKHASIVPECAQAFEEACIAAKIPEGAFKNLFVNYEQVNHIIADPRVQGVALTGSEGAGRKIAAEAGKNLKKSTMELGGTDVCVVLDDADLENAIEGAAAARLNNSGQVCTAAKRYIVQSEIYDDFLAGIIDEFSKRKLGDPLDEHTTLGPLSSKSAQENLHQQVKKILAGGAKVLWGDPELPQGPGALFNPLIISGMTLDNPMYDTELFGPVAQIYKADTEEDIIKIANHSNYGLGGAVYSKDIAHAKALASHIETGQVAINQPLTSYPELPFGGVKNSGYGRELSDMGIREFVNAKTILN
ncbi:succinate-semialdehyde dehydrogenase [Liquorilactobacillus sucicola DSM 21376 = JCM 15457]|uniref:NAD-dependent aldehyde dehydrogenase n=1 Tax=Liquorilactobacillus sucicola DSM 21376 = JCM 15457 TaxID=1423806 RepID=A0A023CZ50_9LACO|nr:NAD-dependent succinate-semialdehyde dehydrogenase [Liquorilactobacillus sucicola]KRN06578.1 NAD-dependent aldehyde dehydrogenase [Liquorilactobacillus sucicola DSM 21376 = JCM 15457]GAJ27168.1 succinate-semialdehyde dehydrogenase [Liquorilactobacillus sucicola DSM 21376 = JCM 15457]